MHLNLNRNRNRPMPFIKRTHHPATNTRLGQAGRQHEQRSEREGRGGGGGRPLLGRSVSASLLDRLLVDECTHAPPPYGRVQYPTHTSVGTCTYAQPSTQTSRRMMTTAPPPPIKACAPPSGATSPPRWPAPSASSSSGAPRSSAPRHVFNTHTHTHTHTRARALFVPVKSLSQLT